MSTKFEQLLDYLVNEEHEKANELFHEIVVEKSREIYENLIAEEEEDESVKEADGEEMDESEDDLEESDGEEMDESDDDLEESEDPEMDQDPEGVEEGDMDLEDSFDVEGDDEGEMGGDATDDLGADVGMDDEMDGAEKSEDEAIFDIKNAIQELEAAFAELEKAQGSEGGHDEFGDEEGEDEMEMMGQPAMESKKRITREYRETVGNDWEKNSQKTQGQIVGANTGDKMPGSTEGKSVVNKEPGGKPQSGANAKNLVQGATGEGGSNTGTSPNKPSKGVNPESGEKFAKGLHNVDGVKSGVKTLSKVAGGHGAEKKGSGPGPVGSGTGDKAGQTSVRNDGPLIKKL